MVCKCGKRAIYNYKGENPLYFNKCKIEGMNNVKYAKCIKCKIERRLINYVGEKALYCTDCKLDDMVNMNNGKCIKCKNKQPNFNYSTESKPLYCNDCKLDNMVDVGSKKCIKCKNRQPYYNYYNETKPLYCNDCKLDNMVNVRSKLCIKCENKQACYNYQNQPAKYCTKCKLDGMINMRSTKCKNCDINPARYNNVSEKKPIYCGDCKLNSMVIIYYSKCKGQDGLCQTTANKKYDGYCTNCFAHLFPSSPLVRQIRTKSKELKVKDFINENFEGFVHNKQLATNHCDCSIRRRPDHYKLINNTLLVIETDENQHKSYSDMDEETRYNDLYMAHSGKWIYIRFNPDKYMGNDDTIQNTRFNNRLVVLEREIKKQIDKINLEKNNELVERIYLYYDGYN